MSDLDKYFLMLKTRVEGVGINPQSLISIGRHAMEISEKSKLKGADKKKLVISMLTKLVNETELSTDNKAACMALVDGGVVESTIDLVIEASKGHLKFNKKSARRILKMCMPLFTCLRSVLAAPRRHPAPPCGGGGRTGLGGGGSPCGGRGSWYRRDLERRCGGVCKRRGCCRRRR